MSNFRDQQFGENLVYFWCSAQHWCNTAFWCGQVRKSWIDKTGLTNTFRNKNSTQTGFSKLK